jgi:aconitate hydratase
MGVLPLQFLPGDTAESLGLTGEETFSITGLEGADAIPERVTVTVVSDAGSGGAMRDFEAAVRIDTPAEAEYYRHGGILQYVLRQLLAA